MAKRCLWFEGWEGYGFDAVSRALTSKWDKVGAGFTANPLNDADAGANTRGAWSRFAASWPVTGFGDNVAFAGSYTSRSKTYLCYVVCFRYTGFSTTPVLGDEYSIAKCAQTQIPSGTGRFPGIGIIADAASTSTSIHLAYEEWTYTGGVLTFSVGTPGGTPTAIAASATVWHVAMLVVNTSTRAYTLYLDGASEVTGTGTAGIAYDERTLPQAAFDVGVKSSDHGLGIFYDDWSVWDLDADADKPGTADLCVAAAQPISDKVGSSAWTGTGDTVNKYANWDDINDACVFGGNDYNTPTANAQDQFGGFGQIGASSVFAASLEYDTNGAVVKHTPYGAVSSGSAPVSLGTPLGGAAQRFGIHMQVTPADGGANASAAWTLALFNAFLGGLRSTDNVTKVPRMAIMAIGNGLTRATKTPCPGRPRLAQVT